MGLFCRCGKHSDVLEKIEAKEVHLLFEMVEELAEINHNLKAINETLIGQNTLGKEAKLVIPIGEPQDQ